MASDRPSGPSHAGGIPSTAPSRLGSPRFRRSRKNRFHVFQAMPLERPERPQSSDVRSATIFDQRRAGAVGNDMTPHHAFMLVAFASEIALSPAVARAQEA